jgi:hypothetical protein
MISLKAYSLDSWWLVSDISSPTLKLVGKDNFRISVFPSNVTLFFHIYRFFYRGMGPANSCFVSEFILVGLTDKLYTQTPLFLLFLATYMVITLGNMGLIIIIVLNSYLQPPCTFSSLTFLHRLLLFFCNYTQNAYELQIVEECYLLHGLYSIFFLLFLNGMC